MSKIQKSIIIAAVALTLFGVSPAVHAVSHERSVWNEIEKNFMPIRRTYGGLPVDPRAITAWIIKGIMSVLGIIYTALIVYGGLLWMTAGGNADQIDKAKSTILHGVIGVGIIITAFAIARLLVIGLGCAVQRTATLCLFMNNFVAF